MSMKTFCTKYLLLAALTCLVCYCCAQENTVDEVDGPNVIIEVDGIEPLENEVQPEALEEEIIMEAVPQGQWEDGDSLDGQPNMFGKIKQYLADWKSFISSGIPNDDSANWISEHNDNFSQDLKELPQTGLNETLINSNVGNETVTGTSNESAPSLPKTHRVIQCQPRNSSDPIEVKVVNSTVLLQAVLAEPNKTLNHCVVVMFYAPWCSYSAAAAPHFNALPRSFPIVEFLAVNAMVQGSLNTRYGIVAIPTVVLFHGGRPVSKFNDTSFVLDKFAAYLGKYTGLQPGLQLNVTDEDMEGPLPSVPTRETDYVLCLAWCFILMCASFGFANTSVCKSALETIRSNWREAEAQHDHTD